MRKILIVFITFTLLLSIAQAKTFSFNQVHSMPQSVEKDYYIWRFLMQRSTSASQAQAIIKEVNQLNHKLSVAYKKKTGASARVYPKPVVLNHSKQPKKHQQLNNKKMSGV